MIPYAILVIEDDNDREFATFLYQSYHRLMFSEILKIVEDSWDAEDVMQNAIIKLINKLDLLRTMDCPHLANYIITASRNTALDLLRERKRKPAYSFDELLDSDETISASLSSSVEDQVFAQFDQELAQKAWKQLPDEVQALLNAKYVLEQSDAEIAQALGIQPNSVRMALTRARRSFRNQLYSLQ